MMTDEEKLSKMSRKEINAEVIHLSREQEEYERQIAYLQEQLSDRDKEIKLLRSVVAPLQEAQSELYEAGENTVTWNMSREKFNTIWMALESVWEHDGFEKVK